MVAVPLATAVTTPLASTVTAASLELFQVTVLNVAFAGSTVATSCSVAPCAASTTSALLRAILVAFTYAGV